MVSDVFELWHVFVPTTIIWLLRSVLWPLRMTSFPSSISLLLGEYVSLIGTISKETRLKYFHMPPYGLQAVHSLLSGAHMSSDDVILHNLLVEYKNCSWTVTIPQCSIFNVLLQVTATVSWPPFSIFTSLLPLFSPVSRVPETDHKYRCLGFSSLPFQSIVPISLRKIIQNPKCHSRWF